MTLTHEHWENERRLAEFDGLLNRLQAWCDAAPTWPPFDRAKALFERFHSRLRAVRLQLDSVLVVGFVGGSGTGKSTLINALVGERVCSAGRERRPTTVHPEILCRPGIDLKFLGLGQQQIVVHERSLPLLENMILIDCPDPDTQPTDDRPTHNQNRDVLRTVLPHCDVIIHVGSQQKYRSELINAELLRHAAGTRVVFVQSQASRDEDIRDHWRETLETIGFHVPEIFRLDAEDALQRQLARQSPDESFQHFVDLLREQLANRARHRIKRANLLDLLDWLLDRMWEPIEERLPTLDQVENEAHEQHAQLRTKIRGQLQRRLGDCRFLWRARLLEQVQQRWGGGLFASYLRWIGGAGSLLRWALVARSRSVTQLAVAGSLATAASIREKWQERQANKPVASAEGLGVNDADIAQSRSILEGYARDAGLDDCLIARASQPREHFVRETLGELATDLQQRLEQAIDTATQERAAERAGTVWHWFLELLFVLLPGYAVYHLGRNFFYDHLYLGKPLVGLEFLIHAAVWILVWGWLLRGVLIWRLTRGLQRDVLSVLDRALSDGTLTGLDSDLLSAAERVRHHATVLQAIHEETARLKHEFGVLEELPVGKLA